MIPMGNEGRDLIARSTSRSEPAYEELPPYSELYDEVPPAMSPVAILRAVLLIWILVGIVGAILVSLAMRWV